MKNFIVFTCSPNMVSVIKSRRLSWAGHVAGKEEGKSAFKILRSTPIRKRPITKKPLIKRPLRRHRHICFKKA